MQYRIRIMADEMSAARAALAATQHLRPETAATLAVADGRTAETEPAILEALRDLHAARRRLRGAGLHRAAGAVALAIKSAEAAYRLVSEGFSPRVAP